MSRSLWNSSTLISSGESAVRRVASSSGNVSLQLDLPPDIDFTLNYLIAGEHLLGNPYNGLLEETWHVQASSENDPQMLVVRDTEGGFSAGTIHITSLKIGGETVIETDGTVISDSILDRAGLRYLRETNTIDPIDFGGSLTVRGKVQIGSLDVLPETKAVEYGSERLYVQGNMVVTGDITALSDQRIKENVSTIENALHKVRQLRGVQYVRTEDARKSPYIGLIAQEVQNVIPEVVHETKEGLLGVSYSNLIAVLIEAVKELESLVCKEKT